MTCSQALSPWSSLYANSQVIRSLESPINSTLQDNFMKLKDYLLICLIFASIAAVAVYATVKLIKDAAPVLPDVVKVSEVNKLPEVLKVTEVNREKTTYADSSAHCTIFSLDAVDGCQAGKKVVFMPQRWGNDQLPIYFVGMYCDLNYPVVWNNGGVVCIKAQDLAEKTDGSDSKNNVSENKNDKKNPGAQGK